MEVYSNANDSLDLNPALQQEPEVLLTFFLKIAHE